MFAWQKAKVGNRKALLCNSTGCNLQINKSKKIDKHPILPDNIKIHSDN